MSAIDELATGKFLSERSNGFVVHFDHAARIIAAQEQRLGELEALLTPKPYNSNIEPVICPACNGAMDDHKGKCPVEAYQINALFQQVEQQEQRIAELEAQQIKLWECPACGFAFDVRHEDEGGGYSCPACKQDELEAKLAALENSKPAADHGEHGD